MCLGEKEVKLKAVLESTVSINEAEVYGSGNKNTTLKRIDPKVAVEFPCQEERLKMF